MKTKTGDFVSRGLRAVVLNEVDRSFAMAKRGLGRGDECSGPRLLNIY